MTSDIVSPLSQRIAPSPKPPFAIPPDAITITDVGTGRQTDTWYWLMLGHHVYDHRDVELNLERLEREIDPNQVMNPILLRGEIWKTVAPRFWQTDDGGVARNAPSQPGLTIRLQEDYRKRRRDLSRRSLISSSREEIHHPPTVAHEQPRSADPCSQPRDMRRECSGRSRSVPPGKENGLINDTSPSNDVLEELCGQASGRARLDSGYSSSSPNDDRSDTQDLRWSSHHLNIPLNYPKLRRRYSA